MVASTHTPRAGQGSRSRLRVILYHHLADKPCRFVDRLGIATPPEVFAGHLKWLSKHYDLVDLDAVLTGNLPRRPLLITFDDGYRSVLDVAAPILREHAAPSVFFVSAAIIGAGDLPLDNLLCFLANQVGPGRLASAITGRDTDCTTLQQVFGHHVAALSFKERMALPARLAAEFDLDLSVLRVESGLFLCNDELPALNAARMELGNHTRSHLHCRCMNEESLCVEIAEHRRTLEQLSGRPVRSFSFPYGSRADATPLAMRALRESGHQAIFLVEARLNPRGHPGPLWHRVSMQDQPASALRRRIEVLPWLRSARDRIKGRAVAVD